MKPWIKIIACAIPAAAILLLSFLLLLRRRRRQRQQQLISPQTPLPQIPESAVKSRFDKPHLSYKSSGSARNSLRFHPLNPQHHQTPSIRSPSPFLWEDHPRLITEAAETGWQRFAFSSSAPLLSFGGTQRDMPPGSSEFMQTVRINPGPKKTAEDRSFSWVSTSLPLPGPALAGGCFPQEAYFEITILYLQPRKKLQETGSRKGRDRETDRSKLIRMSSSISASVPIIFAPQEPTSSAERAGSRDLLVSLGLSNIPSMSSQSLPGTFPGSIGFHSDGSVYLDGRKLVFESEKAEWADVNRVIGCGFAPRKKKVFFTVDSQLAHVIRCTSEAYSNPLYPVLAADADAMILVNLGQAPFKYAPANATRTQNPRFLRLPSVEAEWHEHGKRSKLQSNNYSSSSKKSNGNLDDGLEAESDLFEISLQR